MTLIIVMLALLAIINMYLYIMLAQKLTIVRRDTEALSNFIKAAHEAGVGKK